MPSRALRPLWLSILASAVVWSTANAVESTHDTLRETFLTPPQAAKPRVWWHWMNGNVTQEGIKLDLEWMQRVGIGGVQNFDGAFLGWGKGMDTPVLVERPLVYMTPEWWQALRESVGLASHLGLEFTIASSAGWTTTGGPWVEPKEAMKKLVWSETWVEGGKAFKGQLKQPPRTTGFFQNIPLPEGDPHWAGKFIPTYYADIATIAYRAPKRARSMATLKPIVTSSVGLIEGMPLYDGDLAQGVELEFRNAQQAWIQFSFAKPQSIQALTMAIDRPVMHPLQAPIPRGWLEASDDGRDFRKVADLPQTGAIEASALEQTIAFAPAQARVYRVVLERPKQLPTDHADAEAFSYRIMELELHTAAHVNRFEDKAGFSTRQIVAKDDTPDASTDSVIRQSDIVDLTDKVRADGSLDWTPPRGHWVVLRFGYSLTGKVNDPASPAGTGLEVDKLNRQSVKHYLDTYLGKYAQSLGPELIGQKGLQYVLVDSYEAGPQNWTERMLEEFKARRGYNLRTWLPVLAGRVIESAATSDRLLWDFRKTLGELMRDEHYEQITASLHERGLGRYGESQEYRRFLIGDVMEMKKSADIPMGAMWASIPEALQFNYAADLRESASVAHIYGQNLVAAESFTAASNHYGFAPENLKPIADRMMAEGVNRFVVHTSVHQPDNKPGPGLGLASVGQWFTRKETWANQAQAWVSYLSRSSHLLQQGRFVADIAYLYGEDANVTALFHSSAPPVPQGYGFDFINAEALLHELSVKDGRLVTRSGMQYRLLALDASTQRMSLAVLRKIRDLVQAGAHVVGAKPTETPSLADDEQEFESLARELWGDNDNRALADTLRENDIAPDVVFEVTADAQPRFLHRKLPDGDLYFVSNAGMQPGRLECSFRLNGKKPELWRAETGAIEPLSYRMENERTVVPLDLNANDAVFVVFRKATAVRNFEVPQPKRTLWATLEGPWKVSFQPNLGAPARARFEQLQSWTDRAEDGIKYFSGTAGYFRHFAVSRSALKGHSRIELDLGGVRNLAEVSVNGRPLGVLWKAPFRLDITDAVRAGDNTIEIQVTNLWPNRLIGDQQPGAQKIAFAAYDPFKADSPLRASGLLGPVTLWTRVN
jgi:hypothetical protein